MRLPFYTYSKDGVLVNKDGEMHYWLFLLLLPLLETAELPLNSP